jgi:hypothetical protein
MRNPTANFRRTCDLYEVAPESVATDKAVALLQERRRTNGYATLRDLTDAQGIAADDLVGADLLSAALAANPSVAIQTTAGAHEFRWLL